MSIYTESVSSERLINEQEFGTYRVEQLKTYLKQGGAIDYQSECDGYTFLMLAVDNEDEMTVNFLLHQGANPLMKNAYNEIASDMALTYSPIHQLLNNYELLAATLTNNISQIKQILKTNTDIDFQGQAGYTALLIAVEENHLQLATLLLENNANIRITRNDGLGVFDLTTDKNMYQTLKGKL